MKDMKVLITVVIPVSQKKCLLRGIGSVSAPGGQGKNGKGPAPVLRGKKLLQHLPFVCTWLTSVSVGSWQEG